jgi:hypothetical protein
LFPGSDKEKKITPRELRRIASDPFNLLIMQMSEMTPIVLLGDAGQARLTAQGMKDALGRNMDSEPSEHQELHKAVETACEAADIAFDSALNAAWQLYWTLTECKCTTCQLRRQLENAHLS